MKTTTKTLARRLSAVATAGLMILALCAEPMKAQEQRNQDVTSNIFFSVLLSSNAATPIFPPQTIITDSLTTVTGNVGTNQSSTIVTTANTRVTYWPIVDWGIRMTNSFYISGGFSGTNSTQAAIGQTNGSILVTLVDLGTNAVLMGSGWLNPSILCGSSKGQRDFAQLWGWNKAGAGNSNGLDGWIRVRLGP